MLLYYFLFDLIILGISSQLHIDKEKMHIKYRHHSRIGPNDFHQMVTMLPFMNFEPLNCASTIKTELCLQWNNTTFKVTQVTNECKNFEYITETNYSLIASFNISGIHLYGGSEVNNQHWPFEGNYFYETPFVSLPEIAVLEAYWLTSSGFYLYVNREVPLFITLNKLENLFQIIAKKGGPYIREGQTVLNYTICKFENMKVAHMHAVNHKLGKPKGIPDFRMIKLPIWTTWAKYKANISNKIVLEFAKNIVRYNFPNSQLEIDDKWETCYGSLTVNRTSFPNMRETVNALKRMGFRITLWIHPFVNINCEPYYTEGKNLNYFVKNINNNIVTKWWNGNGSYIDFTNPEAVLWWQTRLHKLRNETDIDSFKFDAGESGWSPQVPIFYEMRDDHPETILTKYIEAVSVFGDMIEVRSARNTYQYPIFVRMMDRETKWTGARSLSTLIPELLHMNIVGYPFVLPDMIGGNGYNEEVLTEELFIRWLEINVFMPTLQFSYPPWDFSSSTCEVTKKFINLHIKYSEKIKQLMIEATETGAPVNRPIWWIDPTDIIAQSINSEFLLGDDILIAPVVEASAISRDIYFPKGIWQNEEGDFIEGPRWVKNYPAQLDTLPYFIKINYNRGSVIFKNVNIFITMIILNYGFSSCILLNYFIL